RFHMLHDKDGGRIQQKRVCSIDGEEVSWEHIVKGFEISKGRYVTVTREELEAFNPKATKAIEIEDFVELPQIDPIYYASTYYLVPDRGAAKPYTLLREAMKRANKVGIGRLVLRTKQYLAAVRPLGKALAISTMLHADEVVSQDELEGLPDAHAKPGERELKMAEQLIESLAAEFDIGKYKDDYREQVLALLERKAAGEEIVAEAPAEEPRGKVVNLMEALQKSLAAAKGGKRPQAAASEEARDRGEVRHRAGPEQRAAKTARAHPPRKAAAARKRKSG
ncbi:MAG TPA: Ku protein, partial [Myxococcales bacterium]|nr:Ku protein [Myxococcales bacterium]